MLTLERKELILSLLKSQEIISTHEIIDITKASESTIRRDLTELEQEKKLKRIHGGATHYTSKRAEPTMQQKTLKNRQEKVKIAEKAASFIQDGDCIFLDAGSTTFEMIPFLKGKKVEVVTNGLSNISSLLAADIPTHVLGGYVKKGTHAFIGRHALETLEYFNFDLAFLGANGITVPDGVTTPDPEEAYIKDKAIASSRQAFILADHTKFGDVTFSKITNVNRVRIITSDLLEKQNADLIQELRTHTTLEVTPV
ncbi:DeoR/GlpR family DNA-binding transcription regulator [Alkalihalobacillus pseudalcaliphilus]|uniref:DeoR/GlpR family DNA-binding transcription regulator n=1 Tax=Alkalihalobacillus pseudalcaliphilus TaxID=79884 RepID=UPI00064D983C|nr:DeoR/GlpR family DNA-binding transcription regulator [Alkalihalobacillus pseudalcaliphilus]KMK75107.1 DeoR faimly transcriptional regulator [Alkalihalobacillus pseudalcaliphilus]